MSTRAERFTSLRGQYARRSLRNHIVKEWNKHAELGHRRPSGEPFHRINSPKDLPRKQPRAPADPPMPPGPVCIIGAGVSGLYLKYLINKFNVSNPEQPISYDILEASNRVGGRCYTIGFEDNYPTPHNYFDAGAMRIPGLKSMAFVLDFMRELRLTPVEYGYAASGTPDLYFNDAEFNTAAIDDKLQSVMDPFMTALDAALETEDWEHATDELFKVTEPYSTRQWLATKEGWTQEEINLAEMLNTGTGNFDESFTETVIDYYDFNNASTIQWWRLNGGMSNFTNAMAEYGAAVATNRHVTDITYNENAVETEKMEVTFTRPDGTTQTKKYATVFCTTSLPCLQQINPFGPITNPQLGIRLSDNQQIAIRSLHYDLSVKVAIKFSTPWWIYDCNIGTTFPHGGSGSTDLPIRTVVYPSWDDGREVPAVLLASYTWSQDAGRIGALAKDPKALRRQIIEDLARLHHQNNPNITYEYINERIIGDLVTWDWNTDPYTGGAFALFGPSQFQVLYPAITTPAALGRFHICGEHASAHHAWIAGSMSSVLQALAIYAEERGATKLIEYLDGLETKVDGKPQRLLDLIDEVEIGPTGTSHLLAELGRAGFAHEKRDKIDKSQKPPRRVPIKY